MINKNRFLQNKYSDIIKIDTDKFEKIKLSKIDMSVMYSNQHIQNQINIPNFDTNHNLDYRENMF